MTENELIIQHLPLLKRYLKANTGVDRDELESIVYEDALLAIRQWNSKGRPKGQLPSFIMARLRYSRLRTLREGTRLESGLEPMPDVAAPAEEDNRFADDPLFWYAILQALRPSYKTISTYTRTNMRYVCLCLLYRELWTREEICKYFSIDRLSLESTLQRARKKIRKSRVMRKYLRGTLRPPKQRKLLYISFNVPYRPVCAAIGCTRHTRQRGRCRRHYERHRAFLQSV